MPEALKWDNAGEHFYRTGVSNVALFVMKDTWGDGENPYEEGVAWNGVTSIEENPDGGDANDFYADNIKYLSLRAIEDFGLTITAYQSPKEFDACDGQASLGTGVTIGQQTRKAFGLAWKTQIGNETLLENYGYEIHIIYNATASPSSRNYETINDSPEPAELSWDVETVPIPVTGHKPTAHLVINSKTTPAAKLTAIEEALFGSTTANATMQTPDMIKEILDRQ